MMIKMIGLDLDQTFLDSNKGIPEENVKAVREALAEGNADHIAEELGDLLFSVVNVCRLAKVDAEEALTRANDKFASRFRSLEIELKTRNKDFSDCSMPELDAIWDKIKKKQPEN